MGCLAEAVYIEIELVGRGVAEAKVTVRPGCQVTLLETLRDHRERWKPVFNNPVAFTERREVLFCTSLGKEVISQV